MKSVLERFEEAYIPEPMSGCWLWIKYLSKDGYGQLRVRGQYERAHRASYTLHKGEIPPGQVVRHTCDTPSCVNPDHLETGSWADNNQDRVRRGRNGTRWTGLCKRGHDLREHGYTRPNGTRYCYKCRREERPSG